MQIKGVYASSLCGGGTPPCLAQIAQVTPEANSYESRVAASFPAYVPQQQVRGVIRISGHGSAKNPWLKPLLAGWQRDFQRFQTGVILEYRMY